MKNPTMTFADYYLPYHPERKCKIEPFLCLSSWRRPTKEESVENPNLCLMTENQMFFYRPFKVTELRLD